MSQPHRVIFLSDQIDQLGGVQRVVRSLADGLTDRGYQVDLVGLEPGNPRHPLPTRNSVPSYTVTEQPTSLLYEPSSWSRRLRLAVRGHWSGLRTYHRSLPRLRHLLTTDEEATIVFTQLRAAEHALHALRGWPTHQRRRVRLFVQYHDAFHAAESNGDLHRLRRIAKHVDRVLALNVGDAEQFRAAGISPVSVARNPIDLRPPIPAERDDLVVAGARYHPQKALEVLLRAWAIARESRPSWRLELYGDGPERSNLQNLIEELGIAQSARLAGVTDDFPAQLARASINVLSSRHEGMGLVLAEAMVAGTACVTTDSGPGVRELIKPERTGLLTPIGDETALAHALGRLMDHPAERARLAAASAEHIIQFGTESVLDQWEQLLGC